MNDERALVIEDAIRIIDEMTESHTFVEGDIGLMEYAKALLSEVAAKEELERRLTETTTERNELIQSFKLNFEARDLAQRYLESAGVNYRRTEQAGWVNSRKTGKLEKVGGYQDFYYAGEVLNKVGFLLKKIDQLRTDFDEAKSCPQESWECAKEIKLFQKERDQLQSKLTEVEKERDAEEKTKWQLLSECNAEARRAKAVEKERNQLRAKLEETEAALASAMSGLKFYATYSPRQHPEGFYEIHIAPGEGGEVRFGTFANKVLSESAIAKFRRRLEVMENLQFNVRQCLFHMKCIGLTLCHVDGNCPKCFIGFVLAELDKLEKEK